jgi:glycosyltransferase involved in cell wall biosynthesis
MANIKRAYLSEVNLRGEEKMRNSSVSICSIVRDCESNLKKNIPGVELLRSLFKESEIVVFENDSKDNTKEILKAWQRNSKNIHVFTDTFGSTTIPTKGSIKGNPFYSISRIEKMVLYRNKYMNFLNTQGNDRDFVIIIDLDISGFDIDGIANSFGSTTDWDCISANGTSLSSRFRRQYHDAYALIEYDKMNQIQTEQSIKLNRIRYSYLQKGMPLFPVDSAYGGVAIYKWPSVKNIYYSCLLNDDIRVQCKSEHVGLHKTMKENGSGKIYINPAMSVKYRSVSVSFLFKKLWEKIFTGAHGK